MIKFLQSGGKATKYLLGGLLLILCASMVTFLIPGFMADSTASTTGSVASVGGNSIKIVDVQAVASRLAQQKMRPGYPDFYRSMLMQQAIPDAINELMQGEEVRYEAERMGIRVSDQELQDALRTGPDGQFFFPGGKWVGQEQYEQMLQNAGMTAESYERNQRLALLKQKLFIAVAAGVDVTPAEMQKAYKEQNTKIKFDYAVITSEDVEKQIKPTDTELKAFYAANKANYQNSIPEKRQVRYFVIDHKLAESKATVTESDLQKYYGDHQDQYRIPERVKVRHIQVNTPLPGADGKVDQKALDAIRAKAEDLLKQLKNGADFAELAKKNSDDSGSKAAGGELGWNGRGQLSDQVEKAAFSMSKGQMSDLVQSSFGFHIVQTEDKEDARLKPFNDVKDEIEKTVKVQKVADEMGKTAGTAQKQAQVEGLDKAAAKIGSHVVLSNPIASKDSLPGVGSAPEFMQAVFGADPKTKPQAQAVKFGDSFAIFEVAKVYPPQTPEFDGIKDKVIKDFKSDQANRKLQDKIQQMADRAHAEHDLGKAAKEAGTTVKTSNLVSGKDTVEGIGPMNEQAHAAFNLKPGEISGPINLGNKGVVIALIDRQEPGSEEAAKGSDEIREQIITQKQQRALGIFLNNLRNRLEKEGKEKVNKSAMESLIKGRG